MVPSGMVPPTSVKGALPLRRTSRYGSDAGGAGKVEVNVEAEGNAAGKDAEGATVDAVAAGVPIVGYGQSGHAMGFGIAPGDMSDAGRAFPEASAAASGHEDNKTTRQRRTGKARDRNVTAILHLRAGEHPGKPFNRTDFRAAGLGCQAFLHRFFALDCRGHPVDLSNLPLRTCLPPRTARCILRPVWLIHFRPRLKALPVIILTPAARDGAAAKPTTSPRVLPRPPLVLARAGHD
jgi:hypothetical protein